MSTITRTEAGNAALVAELRHFLNLVTLDFGGQIEAVGGSLLAHPRLAGAVDHRWWITGGGSPDARGRWRCQGDLS
ncbi:hypothetical protein [Streptomyces sp. NPDC046197]|uniref:hypothetical protein n=1 Tax=Streptomyces sp. NPDC046197 TaxID=3154337 RepID=UPI0033FDC852